MTVTVTVTVGDSVTVPVTVFDNCYRYRGKTVPLLPLPRFYRGNRGFTAVMETVSLSTSHYLGQ